jgi:hypothetical protein
VSSVEQIAENMKIGAISGAEYRKHKNWCHQWSRVQKTWKLVSSVEQSTKNMKTGVISGSTDVISFHVFGILLHRWHHFSCFW